MQLKDLHIESFRSLERVELIGLSKFNVLIGKNNTGKSSVYSALLALRAAICEDILIDWNTVLTDKDSSHSLAMELQFELNEEERKQLIGICTQGHTEGRRSDLINSSFLRLIEFSFRAPSGNPNLLHLRRTRAMAQDNQFAVVQMLENGNEERSQNPIHIVLSLDGLSKSLPEPIVATTISVESGAPKNRMHVDARLVLFNHPLESSWPYKLIVAFLKSTYFFNPFRHSTSRLGVKQTEKLSPDGENLAQVLHTIISNDRRKFEQIEKFLHEALPDLGMLQTPLLETGTQIEFRNTDYNYSIRLHDMGGGIEQLLMAATVLLTTDDNTPIFLEEPESHLHAGAQKYLIQKLYEGGRQVFITTHSSTFINTRRPRRLYQVRYANRRTTIENVRESTEVSAVLDDVGIRNSDLLLSDAVLFVEGPGDTKAIEVISQTLGTSLFAHNVTVLPMGGGEFAERHAPLQSDVLVGISAGAPIPHLFLLDRDERSDAEVHKVQEKLRDRVHILKRRELENYFLVPTALKKVMIRKQNPVSPQLDETTPEQIDQLISSAVDSLKGHLLLRRIRATVEGLHGGLFPRELAESLSSKASDPKLPEEVARALRDRVDRHLTDQNIERMVREQQLGVDADWENESARRELVPGEEIVRGVFQHFGLEYKKPDDTRLIASALGADEIDPEIADCVKRAIHLAQSGSAK